MNQTFVKILKKLPINLYVLTDGVWILAENEERYMNGKRKKGPDSKGPYIKKFELESENCEQESNIISQVCSVERPHWLQCGK